MLNTHSAKGRENNSVGPGRNLPKAPSSEGFREQKNSYGKQTMTLGQRKSKWYKRGNLVAKGPDYPLH